MSEHPLTYQMTDALGAHNADRVLGVLAKGFDPNTEFSGRDVEWAGQPYSTALLALCQQTEDYTRIEELFVAMLDAGADPDRAAAGDPRSAVAFIIQHRLVCLLDILKDRGYDFFDPEKPDWRAFAVGRDRSSPCIEWLDRARYETQAKAMEEHTPQPQGPNPPRRL